MLAGLYANGTTEIYEKIETRDHTERMLTNFLHPVIKKDNQIYIKQANRLIGCEIDVRRIAGEVGKNAEVSETDG